MNIDLTFPASYRVEMLPEYPGGEIPNLLYFPPRGAGGTEGVLLRITSENGDVWMGCFSPFTRTPVLIASPQPDWLFVIADDSGYAVNTRRPSEWSWISSDAVTAVQIVRDYGLILFADYCTITAYGCNGVVWISERLCRDELKIIGIDGDQVIGCGYDPSTESEGRFVLDLFTGAVRESDSPILD